MNDTIEKILYKNNSSSIEIKAEIFLFRIKDRVNESLAHLKINYLKYNRFELAVDFIDNHHSDAVKADFVQLQGVGYYPAIETEMELDYSIKHALIGSYKASFSDLRRALELSVTSIYLTSNQSDQKKAIEWINSCSDTPFFSKMLDKLSKEKRFKDFNDKYEWVKNLKQFYWNLSNFSHNKGRLNGYQQLNKISHRARGTIDPSIKLETLAFFCDFYIKTVEEIVIMLALYNPVILVGLPLDEKFGLNPPASGFYNDHQSDLIHKLIPDQFKQYFIDIANNDEDIKCIIEWINSRPDLTDEDFEEQRRHMDELF